MAELLIKAKDQPESAELTAIALATGRPPLLWRRGDVIAVRPDGHVWGSLEKPPAFLLVKLPGVVVGEVRYLSKPHIEVMADPTERDPDNVGEVMVNRSRGNLDLDSGLPIMPDAAGVVTMALPAFDVRISDRLLA